jgi:hypothetical protein
MGRYGFADRCLLQGCNYDFIEDELVQTKCEPRQRFPSFHISSDLIHSCQWRDCIVPSALAENADCVPSDETWLTADERDDS